MARRNPALVTPAVLAWARESAGYSLEEVGRRLGKDRGRIEAWEQGRERPLMGQARKLSELYKRPLSDFYLPGPPGEGPMPHDFRRAPGEVAFVYTPQLRRQLRMAKERRELALALYDELDEEPPRLDARTSLTADPEAVGAQIRQLLGVELEVQRRWGDGRPAYNAWRRQLEARGILVFQAEHLAVSEAWGFALVDGRLPVIGVNRKLAPNGRTFTMLHELVHILLGESSICDIDDVTARGTGELRTEVFCNHAAAAALMPLDPFLAYELVAAHGRAGGSWKDEEIRRIAKAFGASREAVLRRLLTFGLTDRAFYGQKRAQYQREREERRRQELDAAADIRRNMPQEAISNLGRPFVNLILQSYHEDRITLMDASDYLGVRAEKVRSVEALAAA